MNSDTNVQYGFFDGTDDPYKYSAKDFNGLFKAVAGSSVAGIYAKSDSDSLKPEVVSHSMAQYSLKVNPGLAIVGGVWIRIDEAIEVTTTGGGGSPYLFGYIEVDTNAKKAEIKSYTTQQTESITGTFYRVALYEYSQSPSDRRGRGNLPFLLESGGGGGKTYTVTCNAIPTSSSSVTCTLQGGASGTTINDFLKEGTGPANVIIKIGGVAAMGQYAYVYCVVNQHNYLNVSYSTVGEIAAYFYFQSHLCKLAFSSGTTTAVWSIVS